MHFGGHGGDILRLALRIGGMIVSDGLAPAMEPVVEFAQIRNPSYGVGLCIERFVKCLERVRMMLQTDLHAADVNVVGAVIVVLANP